ncbi:actin-binding LIM protein 3-like isoform X1 [Dermatophagoides pteronyssinus]|uniref:actin-binding LIM protein 3-like isoform X1 n=1 Tax=Dermatophagoides pteronyssinus TaxID=6956 RepID=UPI003F66CA2B
MSGKVLCESCLKKCSGNVLRVGKVYFHIACFKCHECGVSLSKGGFFTHSINNNSNYYCTKCYQNSFGTKCAACNEFVEGEVISALGNTYHQQCFRCNRCRQPFPSGEKVTWTGKECLCSKCIQIPTVSTTTNNNNSDGLVPICQSCNQDISDGQALIALDKHWHISCFKCETCGCILHGEYLSKDDKVYCEKDYQKQFGIKCHHCERYITGKVLQAGDNHFHPTCARCIKCGDVFSDGEEMYIQGAAIWHPRCGPGPGEKIPDENLITTPVDHQYLQPESPPSMNSSSLSRSISPFGNYNGEQLNESYPYLDKNQTWTSDMMNRYYTYSYLTAEPTLGYLRKPIDPRPPKSPQFHRPPDYNHQYDYHHQNHNNHQPGSRRTQSRSPKQGMRAMLDQLQATSNLSRPKSPSMNNEEPIELSHYPSAQKPNPNDVPTIERDDFPAPPFPYADPNLKKWYNSKDNLEEEFVSKEREENFVNPQLKKEEEELSKIATGIGKVFLKTVKEREKIMAYRRANLDPRNASRTPSARTEIPARLRYDNPVNASPSRDIDRPKPWEEDEYERYFYRNSRITRSQPYINYNVVSSLRNTPKPGYSLKHRENGDVVESPFTEKYLEKTQSAEFGSKRSNVSAMSDHQNRYYMNHSTSGTFRGTTTPYSEGFGTYHGYHYPQQYSGSFSPHFRRSMPNVNLQHLNNEPAREYPYHLLMITNYRLPPDVDRCHLERHLENSEFERILGMNRMDFYRLPEWKRNELKKRVKLF